MTEQPAELLVLVILPPVEAAEVAVDDALEQVRCEGDYSHPYGSRAAWEIGEIRRFDQPFALDVLPEAIMIREGRSGLSWIPRGFGYHADKFRDEATHWREFIDRMIACQETGIAAWVRVTPHSDHPRPVVPKPPGLSSKLYAQAAAIGVEAYRRGARREDGAFWELVAEIEAERGDPWETFEKEVREGWDSDHDVDYWIEEYADNYWKAIRGAFRCLCSGAVASEHNIFMLGHFGMIATSEGDVIRRDSPEFDELTRPYLDKKQ